MKEDCRNGCVKALLFPRKLDNRPALSHLDFRIGTYADIRDALLRNLDKTPELSGWTYRGADDPGIALLEGAAILGDILTFYQERYANEAYLRTAEWRDSISDLVRLLGYRLSPGLGGKASFAFEVKGDQPVVIPPNFPLKAEVEGLPKPADFETVAPADSTSRTLAYPWLSKFNLYCPLHTPDISTATNEFYIQAPVGQTISPVRLKVGDKLVIGDFQSFGDQLNQGEIIIVDLVRELHGVQLFKIKGNLKRTAPAENVTAYKLGRTFHHFGYNGPPKITRPLAQTIATSVVAGTTTTTTTNLPAENNISFSRDSIHYESSGVGLSVKIVEPSLSPHEFPLDGDVNDLAVGTKLVLQAPLSRIYDLGTAVFTVVREITDIRSTSMTWGLSTGTSSIVTLHNVLAGVVPDFHFYDIADIRSIQFHETLSPPLTLRAAFQPATPSGHNVLNFYGTPQQAQDLNGRKLFFVKATGVPDSVRVTRVDSASAVDGEHPLLHKVTLDANDLHYEDFPNALPYKVTVYGNIVQATQGKTEKLTPLGNGDSRLVFQTFKLPKSPLTYLHSDSVTPPEVPELQIYVNNRLWKRVASFFGRQPDEQIYIVREDPNNISWVQFGDGKTGARVPSGIKNVTAVYRSGTGAFGALKEKTKVQASAKLDRLDKIQMPEGASGGAQPEDGENARAAAPGKIQSLDRLVSLQDFESEALGMAGITKAAAAWELVVGIPQVSLTVLMGTGRADTVEVLRGTFATANSGRGPNRFPIMPVLGQLMYVTVQATFGYDATYLESEIKKEIKKALGVSSGDLNGVDDQSGLFSLGRRNFGQKEYATTVAGTIQQVAGVIWAKVTCFQPLNAPTYPPVQVDPALLPLPALFYVTPTVECPKDVVLGLYKSHLQLTGMKETLPEVRT